jgi:hypothetical protein
MRYFVYLHVLSMVSAVAVAYGPALMLRRAANTRHVPTIRSVFGMAGAFGKWIPILFLLGLGFAIIAIFANGFNPLRPWLLIAYVLFAIGMFDGARIHGPYAIAVAKAAASSPDEAPSAELRTALDNPGEAIAYWVDLGVVALILFDMIIKPFGA